MSKQYVADIAPTFKDKLPSPGQCWSHESCRSSGGGEEIVKTPLVQGGTKQKERLFTGKA